MMKFSIPVPTYKTYVNIYISSKQIKLDEWNDLILQKFGQSEVKFEVAGRAYDVYLNKDGFRCADIIINKKKMTFGVIAHEVLHAVNFIMDFVDIELCQESEEAYTYLVEYLIDSIHSILGSKL